jgi:hypothetical protein
MLSSSHSGEKKEEVTRLPVRPEQMQCINLLVE